MGEVTMQPPALRRRLMGLAGQMTVILLLDKIYEATRGIVPHQAAIALQNGLTVVSIERSLHIFFEWRVQAIVFRHRQWALGPLVIDQHALISAINHFYLYAHFLFTPLFLIGLYLWRKDHFPFVRDVIVITTGLALMIYIAFPMMPPRLMGAKMHIHGYRLQDTLAPILNYKLQQAQIGYNPYAAMPSLHFAWALILGVTLLLIGRFVLLRLLGLLYPVMMLATIVISGNHLWLDAAGSIVVVAAAVGIAVWWHRHLIAFGRQREQTNGSYAL